MSAAPLPLSLVITPAVIDAEATGAGDLPAITLRNRSAVGFHVKVVPALAAQGIEGGLALRRGSRSDALARRVLRVQAPGVVGPRSAVEVRPSFLGFAGRSSLTLTAAITATPLHPPSGAIRFRFVLLPAIFVHRPTVAAANPVIASVRAKKVRRLLELAALVRNRGRKPAFVTAVDFRILDARGKSLAHVSGSTGYVAPSSARYFRAQLSRTLPPGRLRAEAIVRQGGRETRRSGFFRVPEPRRS